jgi:hypothetical protein
MPKFPPTVKKIGVELEGGFTRHRRDRSPIGGGDWHGDGSVYMDGHSLWCGEAVSPPIKNWTKLASWVKNNYPNRVNRTCGTHMHVSFKGSYGYSALVGQDSGILDRLEEVLRAWAKDAKLRQSERKWLFNRLDGNNTYCKKIWDPDRALQGRYDRYSWLNAEAWRKHGTIEIRILPAFWSPGRMLESMAIVLDWMDKEIKEWKGYDSLSHKVESKVARNLKDEQKLPLKVGMDKILVLNHGDEGLAEFNRALQTRGYRPHNAVTRFPEFIEADWTEAPDESEGM